MTLTDAWAWIPLALAVILSLGPNALLLNAETKRQEDLVVISQEFEKLNTAYLIGVVISLTVTMVLLLSMLGLMKMNAALPVWPMFAIMLTLVFLWVGFSRGYVAMKAGVYPVSKIFGRKTQYAYSPDEVQLFRKLGRIQVYVAVGATALMHIVIATFLLR